MSQYMNEDGPLFGPSELSSNTVAELQGNWWAKPGLSFDGDGRRIYELP